MLFVDFSVNSEAIFLKFAHGIYKSNPNFSKIILNISKVRHVLKLQDSCNGFIEGRHTFNLLLVKWSNI